MKRNLHLAAAVALVLTAAAPASRAPAAETDPGEPLLIQSLPGITVDTQRGEVRVKAEVCLQEGGLELFVCSDGTREHESVLVVKAQPSHVTYALALLGLDPGKPGYRTEGGAFSPPAGAVLDIQARFTGSDGKTRQGPAWKMLRLAGSEDTPPRPIEWVFVGLPGQDALQAADREGTVVCLSNFPMAVVDVPFESTDVNANLLYEANPRVVPPVGTPVELVLRPTGKRIEPRKVEIEVVLTRDGRLALDGEPTTDADLRDAVNRMPARVRTTVLRADPDVPFGRVIAVRDILRDALMQVVLTVRQPEAEQGPAKAPPPLAMAVAADDRVRIADRTLTLDEFRNQAADLLKGAERAVLAVQPNASWKTVAEVIAVCRQHQIVVAVSKGETGAEKPPAPSPCP